MPIRPLIGPALEPVTLAEARLQCRCDPSDTTEDTRLSAYIAAARGMAEQETGARLITQTWEHTLDRWPTNADAGVAIGGLWSSAAVLPSPVASAIELPQAPVLSVASVAYVNTAGATITLGGSAYRLDTRGPRGIVRPAFNTTWPTDVRIDVGVITVTYTAGFGPAAADVPAPIREWILAHVAAMFEQRSAISDAMTPLPYLARLLDEWRVWDL